MDSEATGTEEYSKNSVVSWIRETSGVPWARQKEPQSLHVNTGSFLLLPPFYRQQKELMLCAAPAETLLSPLTAKEWWLVWGTTHRAKQTPESPWGITDHHAGTRCHCLPSSILGIQQEQQREQQKQFSGLDTKVSKANCAMENHIPWKDPCKDEEEWNRSLWNPALPLLEHTALCRWKISLPLADDRKRERRLWSECQWQMWVSAAATRLLLCNGNFIWGVSKFTSYQPPHKFCKV